MRRSGPACVLPAAVILAVALAGCTEVDETIEQVGVARLAPVDPSVGPATLDDAGLQYVEWEFARAELRIGEDVLDLLGGDSCLIVDGPLSSPRYAGKCGGGTVAGVTDGGAGAGLSLELTMRVRRVDQPVLAPQDDFDGDGIANGMDLCPIQPDPMQEDDDDNGIGDACQGVNLFTGLPEVDSDADRIVDSLDNCLFVPNPGQENTNDPLDGIGDACDEQNADVTVGGNPTLQLTLDPGSLNLAAGRTMLVVVDFDHLAALNCDWAQGNCTLDPAAVQTCFSDSSGAAAGGCP